MTAVAIVHDDAALTIDEKKIERIECFEGPRAQLGECSLDRAMRERRKAEGSARRGSGIALGSPRAHAPIEEAGREERTVDPAAEPRAAGAEITAGDDASIFDERRG